MQISYQLYSSRNFTPWSSVLPALAALGYRHVEGFGGVYSDPVGFRGLMAENKMTMPSAHFGLSELEADLKGSIAIAATLGVSRIYAPYLAESDRPTDTAGWRALALRLANIGEQVRAEGFAFGWHNHDFEFMPLQDGGLPMRILLETAPTLEWEADIAWIARANADPSDWITEFGSRITAAHVKDIAPSGEKTDEDGWADVGTGVLDWAALTAQLRAQQVELFVMEHDNPSDHLRFAQTSLETFKTF